MLPGAVLSSYQWSETTSTGVRLGTDSKPTPLHPTHLRVPTRKSTGWGMGTWGWSTEAQSPDCWKLLWWSALEGLQEDEANEAEAVGGALFPNGHLLFAETWEHPGHFYTHPKPSSAAAPPRRNLTLRACVRACVRGCVRGGEARSRFSDPSPILVDTPSTSLLTTLVIPPAWV